MKDVTAFDPTTFAEAIKERIKIEFLNFVPDEKLKGLIEAEIRYFFMEKKSSSNTSYRDGYLSDFSKVCNEIITEICRERVKQIIGTLSIADETNANKQVLDAVIARTPEIIANMMAMLVTQTLQQIQTNSLNSLSFHNRY
jgi:hypothetical protein